MHRRLSAIDAFLDAGPRRSARIEECGPFTLFVSEGPWPYFARPRLGGEHAFTVDDVRAARARLTALGQPETFQWVHETAPSLLDAVEATDLQVLQVPLLVLETAVPVSRTGQIRILDAEDPALPAALAVERVGFGAPGTAPGPQGFAERETALASVDPAAVAFIRGRMRRGESFTAVAELEGGPVAVGTLRATATVAEIVAVATLPAVRRQGLGGALTGALVEHAAERGIDTVFLSAASDAIARLYERLGFRRAATACFVL